MNGGRPASKSPVAYYKFDEGYGETVHDSSGNGNDGTASSSDDGSNTNVTEMWDSDGRYNKAMEFDGYSDYVGVPSLDPYTYKNFTISTWYKSSDGTVEDDEYIYWHTDTSDLINFSTTDDSGESGHLRLVLRYNTSATYQFYSTTNIVDQNWHFLSAVRDNGYVRIYIDGEKELDSIDNVSGADISVDASDDMVYIGQNSSGAEELDGKIDELKIFNYALTDDEIKKEYNRGASVVLGSTGIDSNGNADNSSNREYCIPGDTATCTPPILELKMDEKQGSTAYDTSGNGNDGTISGASWGRGKIGSGLEFDGVNDRIKISANSAINNIYPMTLSFWVNSDFQSGDTLFEKGNISDSSGFEIKLNSNRLEIQFDFDGGMMQYVSASDFLTPSEWQFITLIWDGTPDVSNIKLYGNGALDVPAVSSDGSGTVKDNSPYDLYIGSGFNVTPVGNFPGKLDGIKIYDYARTPAQIAWDYNKGKPIAEWRFDECRGSVAYDNSGNGNNGTITIGSSSAQTELGNCSSSTSASAWYNGRNGKTNSSLSFDGTDDYISVSEASMFDLEDSTFSFWVKPDVLGNAKTIMDLDFDKQWIGIHQNRFGIYGRCGGTHYFGTPKLEWQHVAWTVKGSNYAVYVDGKLMDSGEGACNSGVDVDFLTIGATNGGVSDSEHFDGQIDQVKIWNYALTAEQIKTEYNSGAIKF